MDVHGRLEAEGVALRLEGVDRRSMSSGEITDALRKWRVSGLSPHPAVVAESVRKSTDYERQMRDLALRGADSADGVRQALTADVRRACDALRPAYDGELLGSGCATLPVPPWSAESPDLLLAEARTLSWEVDRPNLVLGLTVGPGTAEAASDLLAEGHGVHVSGTASASDMADTAEAFLEGLERARAAGHELSRLRCVVSVPLMFLGQAVSGAVSPRAGPGGGREEADAYVLACARFLYHEFESRIEGPRWGSLAADGAFPWELSWSVAGTASGGRFVGGPAQGGSEASLLIGWGTSVGSDLRGLHAFLGDGVGVPENVSGEIAAARAAAARARSRGIGLVHLAEQLTHGLRCAEQDSWLLLRTAVSTALDRNRVEPGAQPGGGAASRRTP